MTSYSYGVGEQATILTGTILGVAGGLTATRYILIPKTYDDPINEVLAWTIAAVVGIPFETVGATIGGLVGMASASRHRQKRLDKERLENIAKLGEEIVK